MEHPNLRNPKDFDEVREYHFEGIPNTKERLDPKEELDRMEARERNQNKNSR